MGIFEAIRKGRAKTKAEIQAAKVRAKSEAKAEAKLQLKREQLLQKFEKNLLKEERKGLKAKRKHERKMAENTLEQLRARRLNAGTFKRYAGLARVALKARIDGINRTLNKDHLPTGFVQDVQDRLSELHTATDNAEFMTAEQRRRAHATIARDIDGVTQEIQERLRRP